MEYSKNNNKSLLPKDYAEINIIGDGNCFFRCLSQFFDNTQEYYSFYRQLIFNYIMDNKRVLKDFFPMQNKESNEKYNERYEQFILAIQKIGNYAGDYEISASTLALKISITIVRKTILYYEFLQNYSPNEIKVYPRVYIVYRNNHNFNLLLPNSINLHYNEKKVSLIKEKHDELKKSITLLNKNDAKKCSKANFFNSIYVKYLRDNCTNLYNEIFDFLINKILPKRIQSKFQLSENNNNETNLEKNVINNPILSNSIVNAEKRKKEKRTQFRKTSNNLYFIKENRLFYKYTHNGVSKIKKIPYEYEVFNILFNSHVQTIHVPFNKENQTY